MSRKEMVKTPDYENVVGQDELTRFDSKIKSGRSDPKARVAEGETGSPVTMRGARSQQNRGGNTEQRERNPRPARATQTAGRSGQERSTSRRSRRGAAVVRKPGSTAVGKGDRPQGGDAPKPPAA